MITVAEILTHVQVLETRGDLSLPLKGLSLDSRTLEAGFGFLAIRGHHQDGHDYMEAAAEAGASMILCEHFPAQISDQVVYVRVADSAEAAGEISSAFHGHPSRKMKVVGITGTNGKTTVATLLYQLYRSQGEAVGLISTVSVEINGQRRPSTHTTPDSLALQSLLHDMEAQGCRYVFMEVSSHAIDQRRIAGLEFHAGVFTNISHDHLDYHGDFRTYVEVKKRFFDQLPDKALALSNRDDRRGDYMLQNTRAQKAFYSLSRPADYKGKVLENSLYGLQMAIGEHQTHFLLLGLFNAYNLLAAFGVSQWLGMDPMDALRGLSRLQGAPGRMETLVSPRERLMGIVDYAHTPDALRNVLATIEQFREKDQRLITLVGCGGDRDQAKRPLMAELAARYSDQVILTSDNPRSEDPESILDDMESGLKPTQKKKVLRITDRREAIRTACLLARQGDIILVAGKGHETYQEIRGKRMDFDDRLVLKEQWESLDK